MKTQLAAIKRSTRYSPNHITNDELILVKTIQHLQELGMQVKIYNESEILSNEIPETVIITMARGKEELFSLLKLEEQGKLLINSPKSSINCYRTNMIKILTDAGIPFPKSFTVSTDGVEDDKINSFGNRKVWVKRGDIHAEHREDVSAVYSVEELKYLLIDYARRGIDKAVIQDHVEGDVVKFYAVQKSNFFKWYYLEKNNHVEILLNPTLLKILAEKSAEIMDLQIYGGDAIVSEDGSITIIDINDWPSFAPFRDEASKKIAELIYSRIRNFIDHRALNNKIIL